MNMNRYLTFNYGDNIPYEGHFKWNKKIEQTFEKYIDFTVLL